MEHQITSGENGSVHYWVKGKSDHCIVFTHRATMDHGLFQHQIEYFARQYKIIVWDVPMHGLSRPCEGFSLPKAASDLIRILNSEKVEKAHLATNWDYLCLSSGTSLHSPPLSLCPFSSCQRHLSVPLSL
jgi:pimeloyl-ACP methyl ester carboxylesterase